MFSQEPLWLSGYRRDGGQGRLEASELAGAIEPVGHVGLKVVSKQSREKHPERGRASKEREIQPGFL